MILPQFILKLQGRENRDRYLQAIRTRYLLILGIWTFVVATCLLWGMTFYLIPIHIVVGLTLAVNTASYYLTRRWQFPLVAAIVSIITDVIAITVLVYFTGGFNSMFFLLYLVEILGVSLFLNLPSSALMIAWAVILVGTMKGLESVGLITASSLYIPTTYSESTDAIIRLAFQAITFGLVAFLGGSLSHKLKFKERALKQEKEMTLEMQDKEENRDRYLQAIRTRYLLILGIWTFVVATCLLWGMTFYLIPIHIVVGLTLAVNTASYYLTRRWQFPLVAAIVSIITDVIAITVLVYFTGGFNSMFFLLYLVEILGVSLFLNLPSSALMIAWAVILIGTMKLLELVGLITASSLFIPTTYSELIDTVIWLMFQVMTLGLVAFLGGNLSSKLKAKERELERKKELEKLYKALQKANVNKARLLVNVSHNLRTPLTSILGFSELLLTTDEDDPQREEFAKIIHTESQYLTRVVSDVLYLSELETGGIEWHMTETDISRLTTEAVNTMQSLALQKGLTLTVDSRNASQFVYGDFDRLKDVMIRLIDNAIKFTVEGVIKVGITSEEDNACVYISDTGIGIPPDIKDRVFEPLEEIYKVGYKDIHQRTGLGLAVCKAVIQHHGGQIWFESEPGRGSTFYFTLPQGRTS